MKRKIPLEKIDLGDEGCHLFCNGKLHGWEIRVLIDTGASKSVLSEHAASLLDALKEVELSDNETSGIGPERVEARFVELTRLKIGNVRIPTTIVGIMNLDHVASLYERMGYKTFDFILGGDILDRTKAVIDYSKLKMYLRA